MATGWGCLAHLQWNPFIGYSIHPGVVPIPAPPFLMTTPLPHVAWSLVNGFWLCSAPSTGNGKEVTYNGIHYMGRLTDAGLIVPHVSIPIPYQASLPWTILFGGSMIMFGASGVQMATHNIIFGDAAADMSCTPFGPAYVSLNLACSTPLSLLSDIVVLWGTTKVGFTLGDFFAALADIAIQLAVDAITHASYFIKKARGLSKGFDNVCTKVVSKAKAAKAVVKKAWQESATGIAWKAAKESMSATWDKMKAKTVRGFKWLFGMADDGLAKAAKATDEEKFIQSMYRDRWEQFVWGTQNKKFTYARKTGGVMKDVINASDGGTDDEYQFYIWDVGDRAGDVEKGNEFGEDVAGGGLDSDTFDRFNWSTG